MVINMKQRSLLNMEKELTRNYCLIKLNLNKLINKEIDTHHTGSIIRVFFINIWAVKFMVTLNCLALTTHNKIFLSHGF
jgi:hypothetical protein